MLLFSRFLSLHANESSGGVFPCIGVFWEINYCAQCVQVMNKAVSDICTVKKYGQAVELITPTTNQASGFSCSIHYSYQEPQSSRDVNLLPIPSCTFWQEQKCHHCVFVRLKRISREPRPVNAHRVFAVLFYALSALWYNLKNRRIWRHIAHRSSSDLNSKRQKESLVSEVFRAPKWSQEISRLQLEVERIGAPDLNFYFWVYIQWW